MGRQSYSEEQRFLFVPVYGDRKSASGKSTGPVSQQQHAAREFHRKARLQQAQKSSKKKRRKNSDEDGCISFPLCANDVIKCSSLTAVGAGRLDPFNASCVENPELNVHEILDHALSYQWSVFRFSNDQDGLNALKADVAQAAMTTPLAWYTVIFAGSTHNAFQYRLGYSPKFNEVLRLTYRCKAIGCLKEEISKSNGLASDAMLLSMVALAAHGGGEVPAFPNLKKSWTVSSMSTAHNIDYYGGMETAWAHMNAIQHLIARRGGLHRIKMKAAAIAIQLYDAFTSWRLFRHPLFPLLQPTSYVMSLRSHTPDSTATTLAQQMISGFSNVHLSKDHQPLQDLRQSVEYTATLSADLDQWERKTTSCPDYVHIHFTRWCIMHDLLNLPDLSDGISMSDADRLYELIRLSTFAYFLFTLVPIPQAGSLPIILALKIQPTLEICIKDKSAGSGLCIHQPGLFLWSVMLGGMCAYAAHELELVGESASPLLNDYVGYTRHLSVKSDVHAWPLVANILKQYLWLENECNGLGEAFWRYACG